MSRLTYKNPARPDKPLVWLRGEVRTPPLSREARIEVGMLLRYIQRGVALAMPASRPMPWMGARCHELRITDGRREWRIIYRVDHDAVVIGDVFAKTTQKTPARVLDQCRRRFAQYDRDGGLHEG
jgi:phage-related protein